MNSERIYTVFTEDAHEGRRMDAVLAELIEEASRSYLQKLIEGGSVFLDGQPRRSKKEKLHGGQRIDVVFPEPSTLEILPQKMYLDIVYEDDDLLLVNKPKG
ncbi:MAG: S4 domain-containing protein, partial [Eubacteriales bacterium]|nr:S4 domain-containing protein [Eubacteriales bacterium]